MLICELDRGDKDHRLQQLGRAERAKFFVLGFTWYHPERNTNEWDRATAVVLTKEIHVSLQNASVRWEMKLHVRPCLHHGNCCLTCSQTSTLDSSSDSRPSSRAGFYSACPASGLMINSGLITSAIKYLMAILRFSFLYLMEEEY